MMFLFASMMFLFEYDVFISGKYIFISGKYMHQWCFHFWTVICANIFISGKYINDVFISGQLYVPTFSFQASTCIWPCVRRSYLWKTYTDTKRDRRFHNFHMLNQLNLK
jgi:hypothetical protein